MTTLALDVGDRRIGIAISDPTGFLVRPLTVLVRRSNQLHVAALRRIVDENDVKLIVAGLPLTDEGELSEQAEKILPFVRLLRKKLSVPVETWDETFTTRDAQEELIAQGIRRRRRGELLDAAAAAVLLTSWLTAHHPPLPPSVL